MRPETGDSLYARRQPGESLYGRTRTRPPEHPAPNNVGLVVLVMVILSIAGALVVVGPGFVSEVRHIVYCIDHAQESICQ